jgi:hypothetical protein
MQSAILGAATMAAGLALVGAPEAAKRGLAAFPRSRLAGWVLTTAVLVWCAQIVANGPLGPFAPYRGALFLITPLVIVAVCVFVDELLAPRALGVLLILLPSVLLAAARWHPSAWRYVMIVTAYAMVLKGSALVLAPYLFRMTVTRFLASPGACRAWGGVALFYGAALVGLGLTVY